jgi:acetylornithine deacetylase/succinyl-diaminopimelate desuccinylase-like protein
VTELATIPTDSLLNDLRQLCALPGSLDQFNELAVVASRVAALMERRGLQTTVIPTAGAPVVVGQRSGRSPYTLLLYHHYDVAPPGPWRAWHHEPFQLAERDNALYGRGVAAGKGPLIAHLAALSTIIETEGELPCGVVVLAEGEGLIGSPSLSTVIADHKHQLRADACLATGGERNREGLPFCYTGVKGLLQMRLTAVGPNQALKPGLAASVPNPLWQLIWAISQIKSDQEEILIDEFYNDVMSPSRIEKQSIRSSRLDETGRLEAWGLGEYLFSLTGGTLVSAEATLPTCNVSSFVVDPQSDLAAIPVVATARLDFQLVPQQRPHTIAELLHKHLKNKEMLNITVERLPGGYPPVVTPFEHPFVQHVCEAGRRLYGAPLNRLPAGPFTLPLFFLSEINNLPCVVVGCARPDSTTYGPNEHIPLDDLVRHGQLLGELLHACALALPQ